MIIFILQLTSKDSTFKYFFPQEVLHKQYKIGVIKLDDYLQIKGKTNDRNNNDEKNNKSISSGNINKIENIFITYNLIGLLC